MNIVNRLTGKTIMIIDALQGADLQGADLRHAALRHADLDFSCLPLWCGGLGFRIDDRIKKQIMYHAVNLIGVVEFTDKQINFANEFHRVGEVARLEAPDND